MFLYQFIVKVPLFNLFNSKFLIFTMNFINNFHSIHRIVSLFYDDHRIKVFIFLSGSSFLFVVIRIKSLFFMQYMNDGMNMDIYIIFITLYESMMSRIIICFHLFMIIGNQKFNIV